MNRSLCVVALCVAFFLAVMAEAQAAANITSNATDVEAEEAAEAAEHAAALDAANNLKGMSIAVITGIAWIVDVVVALTRGRYGPSPFLMSVVGSFSAGVFLCIGVVHLLSEATDIMRAHTSNNDFERFRHAQIVALAGYVSVVFLQRGLFKTKHAHSAAPRAAAVSPAPSEDSTSSPVTAGDKVGNDQDGGNATTMVSVVDQPGADAVASPQSPPQCDDHAGHSHGDENAGAIEKPLATVFSTFAVLLAHGITEGMALGLQSTTPGVLVVFGAIVLHHWAEDLVFSLMTQRLPWPNVARMLFAMFMSLNTSIGIAIGWGIHSKLPAVVIGYILAFSAGTFIMVGATELVPEGIVEGRRNVLQILSLAVGMGVSYLALTLMYTPDAHHH